jgi:hypothetical protein
MYVDFINRSLGFGLDRFVVSCGNAAESSHRIETWPKGPLWLILLPFHSAGKTVAAGWTQAGYASK